jgi:hypothetical protein
MIILYDHSHISVRALVWQGPIYTFDVKYVVMISVVCMFNSRGGEVVFGPLEMDSTKMGGKV